MRIYRVIFWLMVLPTLTLGQVEVRFFPTSGHFSSDQLGMVKVYNPSTETFQAQLVGELKDSLGKIVHTAKSRAFELTPGILDISQNPSILHSFSPAGNTAPLASGRHELCISVLNTTTQQELGKKCKELTLLSPEDDDQQAQTSAPLFSFHGQTTVTAQTSNRTSLFQQTPQTFLRYQMSPQLTLFGIPLAANLYLTTEHQAGSYELNQFAVQLDQRALKARLQEKLLQKLSIEEGLIEKGLDFDKSFMDKLEAIKEARYQDAIRDAFEVVGEKVNPDEIEKHIGELAQLDRIEKALEHPLFSKAKGEWNKWNQKFNLENPTALQQLKDSLSLHDVPKYEKLLQLESRYQEFQKLSEKRDYLQTLKAKLPEVEKLQSKLATLERLQHQDLKSLIADPKVAMEMANLKGPEKWLHAVKNIGIGNSFPIYSPLTLEGMQVHGLHLEAQVGKWYAMTTNGKLQQPLFLSDSIRQPFPARIFAAKAGIGSPEKNHLHMTFMQMSERAKALRDSSAAWYAPKHNVLMGMEGQLNLLQEKLSLQGEVMRSQVWGTGKKNYTPAQQVKWESDSFPQIDTTEAIAWRVEATYAWEDGQARAYYAWIPPTYVSLGMPFLVGNRKRYGVELSQSVWEGKLQTTLYHKQDIAQFNRYQRIPSTAVSSGVRLGLRPGPKWPFVQLNYAPLYQEIGQSDSAKITNGQALLGINSGMHFRIGGLEGQSMLSYVQQASGSGSAQAVFSTKMYSISQLLTFQIPLSFTMSMSHMTSQTSLGETETQVADVAGNVTLFKKWQSSFGGLMMEEKGNTPQIRKGLYWQNSFPLTTSLQAGLRAESFWISQISENAPNPFEYLINLSLTYNW